MNANEYLHNTVIAEGFYNVKCVAAETTDVPGSQTIVAKLRIVPFERYGEAENTVLQLGGRWVSFDNLFTLGRFLRCSAG